MTERLNDEHFEVILAELRALRAEITELRQGQRVRPSVTVEQAAELLGCQRSRVFELLAEGRLLRAKRVGRKAQITRASVEAYASAAPEPAPRARAGERERAEILKLVRSDRRGARA